MQSAFSILKAFVVLAGVSAALPGPWSVPPGMFK